MLAPDEILLLEQLRSGDQAALKVLYSRYFQSLVRTAAGLAGESVLAKDVVQNAFVQIWTKRESLHIETGFLPYLRRMVVNEVLAMQRKAERRKLLWHRQPTTAASHTDVEDSVYSKEAQAKMRAAIDALPERCSEIFKLSRYSELTYQEIADTLDISVKTVENQMGKALKILRDDLKEFL